MTGKHLPAIFILLLSLCLTGCSGLKPATRTPTRVPTPIPTNTVLQDDYAIYTTVLPAPAGSSGAYVIEQTTDTYARDLTLPKDDLPALNPETLSDFNAQNQQNYPLDTIFTAADPHYILVDSSDFYEKPTAENGLSCIWMRIECFNKAKFKAAYPDVGGITLLSVIGYNAGHTQALVAMQFDYGQDSGITDVYLLHKDAGQWQIIDHYEIHWIV